jgi:AraC family transcriptional regulator
MQNIRIIEIPKCKMVSSGIGFLGEEKFDRFNSWFSQLPPSFYSKDFLFWDAAANGLHWLYLYEDDLNVPSEFEIIDFRGGLYAVATDIDQQTDIEAMDATKDEFLHANGFERDYSRPGLGHIITPPQAAAILKYHQMDYFTPIRIKNGDTQIDSSNV